jgi:hypothetical protein
MGRAAISLGGRGTWPDVAEVSAALDELRTGGEGLRDSGNPH